MGQTRHIFDAHLDANHRGAGLIATTLYNNHELKLKHLDTAAQEARLVNQANQEASIAQAKTLEALLKYIASDKPGERAFGYAMFAALGKGDLAATIIGTRQDQAGAAVAKNLIQSPDPKIADKATSALLSLDQESRLVGAVAIMERNGEKTGYEYLFVSDDRLAYGINLWLFPSTGDMGLRTLLEDYMGEPGALYVADLKRFSKEIAAQDTKLISNDDFQKLLRKIGNDPVMIRVQERLLMSSELEPKLQLARQLGAKTALGAAMIFYVMHHETDSNTIFSDTDKSAGGSLNLTTDEKIWTKTLVSIICNRAAELNSKYPAFYRRKCHILTILRESDDWNLDNIAETAKKF